MELISINQARAIWLFPLADLNPRGKAVEGNALPEISARYKFAAVPTPADLIAARERNDPLKFMGGEFAPTGKSPIAVDLSVYRDGIVADSRSSTSDSAQFINDLLTWLASHFGLLPHGPIVKSKLALSEVHVSTKKKLETLNPKLAALAKEISGKLQHSHPGIEFEFGSVGFWPPSNVLNTPSQFRFERAAGIPFEQNRYFSIAPLETDVHLELLDKLEALLS